MVTECATTCWMANWERTWCLRTEADSEPFQPFHGRWGIYFPPTLYLYWARGKANSHHCTVPPTSDSNAKKKKYTGAIWRCKNKAAHFRNILAQGVRRPLYLWGWLLVSAYNQSVTTYVTFELTNQVLWAIEWIWIFLKAHVPQATFLVIVEVGSMVAVAQEQLSPTQLSELQFLKGTNIFVSRWLWDKRVHWVAEKWSSTPVVSLNNKSNCLTIFWAAAGPREAYFPPWYLFRSLQKKFELGTELLLKYFHQKRKKKSSPGFRQAWERMHNNLPSSLKEPYKTIVFHPA